MKQHSREMHKPVRRRSTLNVSPIWLSLVGFNTCTCSSACWPKTVALFSQGKILSACQAVSSTALQAFTRLPICPTQLNPGSSHLLFLLKWRWLVPQWLENEGGGGRGGRGGGGLDSDWSFSPTAICQSSDSKIPAPRLPLQNVKLLVNGKTHANALAEPSRRLIESRLAEKEEKKKHKKLPKLIKM